MKFIRWLGAFGSGSSLSEAAGWELSQTERQVAVEPLWHGRSMIDHAKIGLEVDHGRSTFARGWLYDAYTSVQPDGTLRPEHRPSERQGRPFKNLDRFLAAWSARQPHHHGEAVFDLVHYSSVVVKSTATDRGMRRAQDLAAKLGLPLRRLKIK